ncbi:MAG: bifunctional aconitate hydratase 2/2-methylisocitrate dehydratase [Bacteroidetes bacterium 4572_117]|nr:MAG: bifunctional aconitate hydratase 2/2-methylisocitrate dehydratase [Bacteroidetes bacterium 4572_117]
MMNAYLKHEAERKEMGIPALPLNSVQAAELCNLLENPEKGQEDFLMDLFTQRISPGVDPAAETKADFLGKILNGTANCPLIDKTKAIEILSTMIGGYNVKYLVDALSNNELADKAVVALSGITLVYDAFDEVLELSKSNNAAKKVIQSWANAEWFTSKPEFPKEITVKAYKVDGETNTDDFSPASDASTRSDIPLHSLSLGQTGFTDGIETIAEWRKQGHKVAFMGDVVGTGSSRKSATNSVFWHTGEEINYVPNKKRDAIVIGGVIAPIFFNTVEDSGGLPISCDVSNIKRGDIITINTKKGEITNETGDVVSTFELKPNTIADEYRAGGRIALIIGRSLTEKARTALGLAETDIFEKPIQPDHKENQAYTLAQKMVGNACGKKGVLAGEAVEPLMTTVGSQDTTGPMTADELTELACLKFQSPLFMQSFCHTAAYPKEADVKTHKTLPQFITERNGVSLLPGDGVIHTWLNRMLLPDTVGTGGDSHTRFPMGISFPAGSGLVAFAGALGFMPLDMPESVLVKFKGKLKPGITLRDVVNAIPYVAIQEGMLTVPKKNKINVFNGRILEMEGLPNIPVEQAFELTDAAAERSAAAATIKLSEETMATYIRSNIALLEKMIKDGYKDAQTIQNRIDALYNWLKNPVLMERDENAEYAAVLEVDLSQINEPILACPNDPDDVKLLSEVAGTKIDDVFIGSCMTNIGHFRAASKIWDAYKRNPNVRTYVTPPTRMDQKKLKEEAKFSSFNKMGARIEIPGCSLCMGNQLRVPDNATVFSTSTRNFNNRMGAGAQVYLGSAELAAMTSIKNEIPSVKEYFEIYNKLILPEENDIYKYLQFDELEGYK